MKTKPVEGWKEKISVLLLDIFLKSKPKAQRYPLGQLEKRIGDFIQSLLDQKDKEHRKKEGEFKARAMREVFTFHEKNCKFKKAMETGDKYVNRNIGVCAGKTVIKGTRVPTDTVLERLANGWTWDEVVEQFPELNHKIDLLEGNETTFPRKE